MAFVHKAIQLCEEIISLPTTDSTRSIQNKAREAIVLHDHERAEDIIGDLTSCTAKKMKQPF